MTDFDPHRWRQDVHYRLYQPEDQAPTVICVQYFDYPDYDEHRFLTTDAYDDEPTAEAALAAYLATAVVEVEEFDEWRLTGQPLGHRDGGLYPPYDFTARTPEHVKAVRDLWAKIQTGERLFDDARLSWRHVRIERTPWTEDAPEESK